jgi:uncharacterized coiled-coil DUF342 family protein
MKQNNADPIARNFLDSLIQLEARIRTEPLTPEARTQMLELTQKAKEHAKAKKWTEARASVREVQKQWSKLPRRAL